MLEYQFDKEAIQIVESANGEDVEFQIKILQESTYLNRIKKVQKLFEENHIYSDVLFYLYPHHEYRIIVRSDYYLDFILALMKHQLLQKLEWREESIEIVGGSISIDQ